MNVQLHNQLKLDIWEIANRLRGPYRPPQYRLVMLPIVVLRRLDCLLEPSKDAVLAQFEKLTVQGMPEAAMERILGKAADPKRKHPLYNTSRYTFERLLGDPENIAPNLVSYINGFSSTARMIFDKFKFTDQIEKLDANNRLFTVVKAMADVDLHPDRIDNLQMGYLFEHLVMRFNEQANEEAGDHFTPREVIRLMANLVYTGEQDVYTPGIFRTIYDPACGTGGMLSESEKFILRQNSQANLALHGQEYNDESWAICCSDMLIKDEDTKNIVLGDTLGDGKTRDGFEGSSFHYMLANPPFGVEWKDQKTVVEREHKEMGFSGRFGAGLPAINDGSLLFLQHMIEKMHPYEEGDENATGSKIAIVFNGSPLFSGDAGSGPSNIRRWIIENDWLDAVVALPDQLFYNTGIFTYVWLVTNRKAAERRGKVQLIDGTRFFDKMTKSLNNKRNEITDDQINDLTKIYGHFKDGEQAQVTIDHKTGEKETRVVSRIFKNHEFGFLKVTVERPLRMNFAVTPARIARVDEQSAFANLATSKKRKDDKAAEHEIAEGRKQQEAIKVLLGTLATNGRYMDREDFEAELDRAAKRAGLKLAAPIKKAIFAALGERDPDAEICRDGKGNPEPDSELRDTENIPLPQGTTLPLPMEFGPDKPNDGLVKVFRDVIDAYVAREVLPHVDDAWVDYDKTKISYEIPVNRHFYVYKPPRALDEIEADIINLEGEIAGLLTGLVA
ncbi:type I restriction-modification system subunit M [Rhizobium ruizarguesonis]|uniref:type I restriction-modification system subunit M n=1 Tax=Rhizobium ruizarguesonis TaxID=2081791 RepID=UPI00102F7C6B|nr:class I SAM-dependent DNA methyltransferase [Rhizobium ruizarguesonis]TBD36641.1 SAM-dependent DNA methyltransferase [Rhizobium ruizarguesonis]TBD41407.1 SAM-dependent DNA methyltransferase [Rhizobium ruizarguesonis]TBD57753.1 SAM-dependent DNA methyltransferase [Rhizobium ruizarguesonis]TBD84019.1 SAM-dependent DNA methyltransferase [Rhizobium ruizarguesonis]TBD88842.1 SAM-dependent DNA methyltransferase [Rhizobium ruizarguesonis]